jgi:hypothetical protein
MPAPSLPTRSSHHSLILSFKQAIVTGKSPLENLNDHLAAPFENNGFALSAVTRFAPS